MSQHPLLSSAEDLLRCLDRLNFFHMDLSLSRMNKVLDELGLTRPPFFTIQVCGTNGKGSTATFLAALLRAHGLRTGLYTSPHFATPAERVQIDGSLTALEDWVAPANAALAICPELTWFELVTVISLMIFAQNKVQCAVLEAGLGAKYDATTATAADCVVYTPIALDHVNILGSSIAEIAGEKAHAIRSKAPVITAQQTAEARSVLEKRALAHGAPFIEAAALPEGLSPGLAGVHQKCNAATALTALQTIAPLLGISPDTACVRKGLEEAFIPGRLQYVPARQASPEHAARPAFLLDGAHNPHGMATLVAALQEGAVPAPKAVVFSCLADKDWRSVLRLLAPLCRDLPWHVPALCGERAEKTATIAAELQSLGVSDVTCHEDAHACLRHVTALQGPVLITGSLYLLGEFYTVWPDALHRA